MSFTLFSNRKAQINNAIGSIQFQIAQLQQQLADQQAFLQELGTVEQAGESALNQARTFLTMVRAIDPSQEEVFWQAMDALKNEEMAAIAPSAETEDSFVGEEQADTGKAEEDNTIDVNATVVTSDITEESKTENDEEIFGTKEEESADEPILNGNGKVYLGVEDLNGLTIQQIRKLANTKGIERKGKRWEIANRLIGQVTQEDVNALN